MTPQTTADDFDRAAMMVSAALDDLSKAWLKLPAELREAIMGEGDGVVVGNEHFSARIYGVGVDKP